VAVAESQHHYTPFGHFIQFSTLDHLAPEIQHEIYFLLCMHCRDSNAKAGFVRSLFDVRPEGLAERIVGDGRKSRWALAALSQSSKTFQWLATSYLYHVIGLFIGHRDTANPVLCPSGLRALQLFIRTIKSRHVLFIYSFSYSCTECQCRPASNPLGLSSPHTSNSHRCPFTLVTTMMHPTWRCTTRTLARTRPQIGSP
jgi:hypothetical protein